MPNVIRTVTKSTLISEYHKHYKENQFEPLSNSTLFRILDARAASQRKSLSGLDNIATDGATAFDLVEKIVDEVEKVTMASQWTPTARRNLREGKNYLKTDYRLHCKETESPCPDHCRRFALSNPNDKFFRSGVHIDILLFVIVVKTLSDVENTLKTCEGFHSMEQNRDDLMHDFLQAKDAIFAWKAHILRSENQEKAKQVALKDLNEKSVLIVMDWAMKFVQLRYREKQSDWFGKRGLNWHISSVISKKSDGQYEITSYAHLFNSCKQDWYTVASILEDLLGTISKENPEITQAFLRSDEAGCYHNNLLLAAIHDVSKRSKIKVSTYHFSEPQYGKDVCDRILCPLKSSIRRYCNEGNDTLSAKNMREALQKRPVKGTTVSVNLVNREKMQLVVNKQKNFSSFHNFQYESKGVRVWKAYSIGKGKLVPYREIFETHQGPTSMAVADNQTFFPVSTVRSYQEKSTDETEDDELHECPEPGCSKTF